MQAAELDAAGARVDAATAAQVGKEAGARYAVTGSFADFYGKFRVDARVVDAQSGQILKVVSNDDPALQDRADLYRIIQIVGDKIIVAAASRLGAGAPPSPARAFRPRHSPNTAWGCCYESQGDQGQGRRALPAGADDLPRLLRGQMHGCKPGSLSRTPSRQTGGDAQRAREAPAR